MKSLSTRAFTLVELMVVVAIIGILSAVVYANFGQARMSARDEVRKTSIKDLELAIKLYKAQNGTYPSSGCGADMVGTLPGDLGWAGPGPHSVAGIVPNCNNYIVGLTPDFISELPKDPSREDVNNRGFIYKTNGVDFKLLVWLSVEVKNITSFSDEFARCPTSSCSTGTTVPPDTYAVYSSGAATW